MLTTCDCERFSLTRKCSPRRSTPTLLISCSTSSGEWSTRSSCQRSMAKRWPTPVAWMKTLNPTTKNTVSSSDGLIVFHPSGQPCCSLAPPADPGRRTRHRSSETTTLARRLPSLTCATALSARDHKCGSAQCFAKMTTESRWKHYTGPRLSPTKQTFPFIPPPPRSCIPMHLNVLHSGLHDAVAFLNLCIYHINNWKMIHLKVKRWWFQEPQKPTFMLDNASTPFFCLFCFFFFNQKCYVFSSDCVTLNSVKSYATSSFHAAICTLIMSSSITDNSHFLPHRKLWCKHFRKTVSPCRTLALPRIRGVWRTKSFRTGAMISQEPHPDCFH